MVTGAFTASAVNCTIVYIGDYCFRDAMKLILLFCLTSVPCRHSLRHAGSFEASSNEKCFLCIILLYAFRAYDLSI